MKKEKSTHRIIQYGKDIFQTPEWKRATNQTHHYKTSVAKHSIATANMGLIICDYLKQKGIEVDERTVVRICLLHDLGMLGRDERYKNFVMCGYLHPKNSANAAKQIWDDIDSKSIKAIKSHMWPLSLDVPSSKEAFVLCLADKMASFTDLLEKKS